MDTHPPEHDRELGEAIAETFPASGAPRPLQPTGLSPEERLFPTLTSAQIARIAAHGRRRAMARGELLGEAGDKVIPFLVVVSGEIQALGAWGAAPKPSSSHSARASSPAKAACSPAAARWGDCARASPAK